MAGTMEMSGERRIPAPRELVWQALNDPVVLKASIPGCESLEKLSNTEMKATVSIRMGPVAARLTGRVTFTDIDPPNSCRIAGEGQGGVAGFAKGGADVRLAGDGGETLLTYDVKAQVGGRMAQLGARLIDATARQMADAFFTRFAELVSPPVPAAAVPEEAPKPPGLIARKPLRIPLAVWIILAIGMVVAVLVLLFGSGF